GKPKPAGAGALEGVKRLAQWPQAIIHERCRFNGGQFCGSLPQAVLQTVEQSMAQFLLSLAQLDRDGGGGEHQLLGCTYIFPAAGDHLNCAKLAEGEITHAIDKQYLATT